MGKLLSCLLLILSTSVNGSTLLVLGDSLSAGYGINIEKGWVNLLQQQLPDRYTVVNGSISGDTTGQGLARLPLLLDTYKPAFVLIELGGNDGLQGHPLSHMKKNLSRIIALSIAADAQPILFGMRIPPNYGKRYADKFTQIYTELAEEENVPLIPFIFDELVTTEGMIQEDGIHPTEQAQPLITEKLLPRLLTIIN